MGYKNLNLKSQGKEYMSINIELCSFWCPEFALNMSNLHSSPCFFCLLGMIMGAAASTVYYNLKLRHPTLDLPIIDYDLVLLIMPMLMLGISIGVVFNVIFADWMVTVLLIILFLGNVEMNLVLTLYRMLFCSVSPLADLRVLQVRRRNRF